VQILHVYKSIRNTKLEIHGKNCTYFLAITADGNDDIDVKSIFNRKIQKHTSMAHKLLYINI